MSTPHLQALERRLGALERRNRLLLAGLLGTVALLFLTALAPAGSGIEEVVAAHRFELVDDEGRVLLELGTDADGSTGLFLRDPEGRLRGTLTHDEEQTALFLYDDEETVRVGTAQFAHGGGGYALHGPDGKGAAVLYLKGKGSLTFFDPDGNVVDKLPH